MMSILVLWIIIVESRLFDIKTPRLNNLVVERMKKTLVERVRCLLWDAKLSDSFWAEALNIASYVINLSHIFSLDGDIPNLFGLVRMFLKIGWECSVVRSLCMFLRMRDQSCMLKLDCVSSLVMVKLNLTISMFQLKYLKSWCFVSCFKRIGRLVFLMFLRQKRRLKYWPDIPHKHNEVQISFFHAHIN